EPLVLREAPDADVCRLDVHVHLLSRDDAARLELVAAADEREVVDNEQVAFALEAGERRRPEACPWIRAAGVLPRRIAGGGGVAGGREQLRPAEPAADVREDPRLVHAVADPQLVEGPVADRRRPVPEDVPERSAEGLARLQRFEGRRAAG